MIKDKNKQHSIFIDTGKRLSNSKPHTRKQTYSFFDQKTSTTYAPPGTAPHAISTKNSLPPRRKVSMPIQNKKYQAAVAVGMNDQFLHTRKQSYLNSQFNIRKNKLQQISKENKQIYQRLNSQKSVYSSQQLNKSFQLNNGIKKRLSSSKLSQRSNGSRVSDRSSKSIGRGQKLLQKKKENRVEIKTTSIDKVPQKDLRSFKGLFSVGNPRAYSQHNKQQQRAQVTVSTFRKNDIYSRPFQKSVGRRTLQSVNEKEQNLGMGGLLHRIAEEMQPSKKNKPAKKVSNLSMKQKQFIF